MSRPRLFRVVLTEPVAFAELGVRREEAAGGDRFIRERDLSWLQQADVVVAQDLATWKQTPAVSLFHYIDDMMLTSDSLADLEDAAKALRAALNDWGWAVNEAKVQGPGLSVKLLGVIWLGKTKVMPEGRQVADPALPSLLTVQVQEEGFGWGLWQTHGTRKVPLGFWSQLWKGAKQRYSLIGKQLVAIYASLVACEAITGLAPIKVQSTCPVEGWLQSWLRAPRKGWPKPCTGQVGGI